MRLSPAASRVLGTDFEPRSLNSSFAEQLQWVVSEGWTLDESAAVLRAFQLSYHGSRQRFSRIEGYELAVNGRGIPDDDIDEFAADREKCLLRRGIAFAWDALHEATRTFADLELGGFVSVAPVLMEPSQTTGYVAFCSLKELPEPYGEIEKLNRIMVSLSSTECSHPLGST